MTRRRLQPFPGCGSAPLRRQFALFLSTGARMAIEPARNPKAGYYASKDFVQIVHLADAPLALLATPGLPAAYWPER